MNKLLLLLIACLSLSCAVQSQTLDTICLPTPQVRQALKLVEEGRLAQRQLVLKDSIIALSAGRLALAQQEAAAYRGELTRSEARVASLTLKATHLRASRRVAWYCGIGAAILVALFK